MIELVSFMLLALALSILALVVLLFLQIGASFFTTTAPAVASGTPKFAVIVPAHNESATIRSTIRSITPQLGGTGRLLVVADNCTDDTALLAAAAGAEVTERRDERRIGKGYALDHGVKLLARTGPPDVVVIIDADCEIGAGTLDKLVQASIASGRPAQASNTIHSPASADTFDRISQFAWTVKTLVRPLGYSRLGLPCQLMGTGMALPWSIVSSVNLATGHLAEDQKLTADLALMRKAALFCPEAQVTSSSPQEKEGRRIQRTRWEHGHLAVIVEYFPRLLVRAIIDKNLTLFAIALDLSVPPLALLALLTVTLQSITLFWFAVSYSTGPLFIATVSSGLFGVSIGIAWWRFGRDLLSLRDLAAVPAYCASKIPSFLRFVTNRKLPGSDPQKQTANYRWRRRDS